MNLENLVITDKKLGGGGFATVFVGHLGGMKVAAKKLLQSEREFDNLTREASILRRLRHGKHIAYTYGITLKDENLYMIIEYSEHRDLQNYLKRNKESVTYEQKILFCRGILLGLMYCHSMGIFRNGIKCSDVILGKNLEPKLIDFGSSTTVESVEENDHILHNGSLYWAAPEMFSIKDNETVYQEVIENPYPSDIYSLGTTFCEISYDGTTEFIDSDEPDMDIMLGTVSPKPKDAFLEEIVNYCCQFDRSERISLDRCLTMLDSIAETQLPVPAIDDKWQGIQQGIQANSKLELPHSFILHRPKENLVVGLSELSLLEWLCINNHIEAVKYMIQLCEPEQKQLEWLYNISALCESPNTAEFIQSMLQDNTAEPLTLLDLTDLNRWYLIEALVKAGANCNEEELLEKAIIGHYNGFVQLYAEKASSCTKTVIHHAIEHENAVAVRILASRISFESRDENGDTPLLVAIDTENVEIVKILLDLKADVHKKNNRPQHAPLYRAAVKGNNEIVELLINAGATIDTEGSEWHSLVQDLEQEGKSAIIQLVSNAMRKEGNEAEGKHSTVTSISNNGDEDEESVEATPLCIAIRNRQPDVVQKLIDDGANANEHDDGWYLPLYQAAIIEDKEVVGILLKAGADINTKNADRVTVLLKCVNKSLVDMVQFLVEKGADINTRDESGYAPIHSIKDREVAEILLAHGADVNTKNTYGITPLFECVDESLVDMVQFLIEKGADVNARDINSCTPIYSVMDREIAEILVAHGADVNAKDANGITPLFSCVSKSLVDIVQFLIEKGADVNARDSDGFAPIHPAKDREIAEILIACGADINARNANGATPLFECVEESLVDMVQFLVENGADVNVRTQDGFSPIHFAKNKQIVEILIACGADINAKSNDGKTLFDILLEEQNENLSSTTYKRKEVNKLLEYLKSLQ